MLMTDSYKMMSSKCRGFPNNAPWFCPWILTQCWTNPFRAFWLLGRTFPGLSLSFWSCRRCYSRKNRLLAWSSFKCYNDRGNWGMAWIMRRFQSNRIFRVRKNFQLLISQFFWEYRWTIYKNLSLRQSFKWKAFFHHRPMSCNLFKMANW